MFKKLKRNRTVWTLDSCSFAVVSHMLSLLLHCCYMSLLCQKDKRKIFFLTRFLKFCGNRPCYIPKVRAASSTPAILWQFRHLTVDNFIEVGLVMLVAVSRGCILSCCFTLAILWCIWSLGTKFTESSPCYQSHYFLNEKQIYLIYKIL